MEQAGALSFDTGMSEQDAKILQFMKDEYVPAVVGVMKMLKDEIPDLTFTHGTRQKVTSFMFHHMPNLFIELYYLYGLMAFKKVWKIWKR